jgi:ATP-dependent helicase/nuclease subunit A
MLYKNFRSRSNVLDTTNMIFKDIMSKKLGEINYDEDEYLNLGATFDESEDDLTTELNLVEIGEAGMDFDEDEDIPDELQTMEKTEIEARLCARKIQELVQKGRNYRDICILLRSPSNEATIYEKELTEVGIPFFSDESGNYLESIEVNTIISLLKIIDNPLQDIPLVTVLRSPIGGFKDNDVLTNFFENIRPKLNFKRWYFGHYHMDKAINTKEICMYEKIERIY